MFALKSRLEIVTRVLFIAVILFNASVSVNPIYAAGSKPTASPTPTQASTQTPTAQPSVTSTLPATQVPTQTATAIPLTATPVPATATDTTSPIETMTPAPMGTTSQTPSATSTTIGATTVPVTSTVGTPVDQTPAISLSADPNMVSPDSDLLLQWSVTGIAYDGLVLQITLPEGLSIQANQDGKYDDASHTLTISLSTSSGKLELTTGTVTGDVTFVAVLMKDKDVLTQTKLVLSTGEQFQLDTTGGAIQAESGKIKLEIPDGVLPEKTVIEVGDPTGDAIPAYSLSGHPFEITAHGEQSGADLHHFQKQLAILASYADLAIPDGQENDLYLYWYNPETKDWEALPTTVDKETKILRALTDHFTVFDINVNNWQSTHLPTVDSFQVSSFTGAATYSYPIKVPAGPGGFQPSVSLSYNSQVVDQSTLNTQASWVGMGWSLDTGSIEMDTHGTSDWGGDDTYLLNVGGVSTRIVKDTNGVYHAADENFWKITSNANNTWTVQDKQGNIYSFGRALTYPSTPGCQTSWVSYRWMLTSVTNIFGQQIVYDYANQTKSITVYSFYTSTQQCVSNNPPDNAVTATYPSTITYAFDANGKGRYRVRFSTVTHTSDRADYTSSWDTDAVFHTFEKSRLENIFVEQDADGDGVFEANIRSYKFSYKANTDSDIIFPGYTWTAGGKANTLKSVQEFGIGGGSLPAVTFTYGDNLHLTRADNGYGGAVEFSYDTTPWYYQPHAAIFHTHLDEFGQTQNTCNYWKDWPINGWVNATCSHNTNSNNSLHVHAGVAYDGSYNITRELARPGGMYQVSSIYGLDPNVTLNLGMNDGLADHYSATNATGYVVQLPATASQAIPLVKATGTTGDAKLSTFKYELLTSIYRVTEKRVITNDPLVPNTTHTYAYDYAYIGAAVNDSTTSSGVCGFTIDSFGAVVDTTNCYEFNGKFSEFRGHSQVTETRPDGTKTITNFNQDDTLKGQPSSVITNDGLRDTSKAIYTYTTTSLPIDNYRHCNTCNPFVGLSRSWVYTNAVENRLYPISGNYGATKTLSAYESTYGNLTTQTEQAWSGSAWSTYRTTLFEYFPNTANYLVGLLAHQQVKNSANTVIAETLNLYDANANYNQAPTTGILNALRTWVDTTRYSQKTLGYDAWGNQTSVTEYSGYGSLNTAPTIGPRTTTTVYDQTYHIYPLSVTNALSQTTTLTYDYTLGVPLTESDANDSPTNDTTITAQYDPFGRIIQLVRPGDSSTSPTISMVYHDFFPFTTTITQKIDATNSYTVQRIYDGMGRQTRTISGGMYDTNGNYVSGGIFTDTNYVSPTQTQQSLPYNPTNNETPQFTITNVYPTTHKTEFQALDGTSANTIQNGLVTTSTDARGNTTVTTNDIWGRVVSVTPPTGPAVAYLYDEMNQLVTTSRGSSAALSSNPGTTNLVSWWDMNEASGTRKDSNITTNHNDLSDVNTVAGAAKQGNAARFVAANQEHLTSPDNASLRGGDIDFTLVANVYFNNLNTSQIIMEKGSETNGFDYRLLYNPGTGLRFRVTANGVSGVVDNASIQPNIWYTVVAWHDSVNNTVNMQVNNGAVVSIPYSGGSASTSNPLTFGSVADGTYALDGRIDEAALYKRVLTASERTWLYNNGNGHAYADLSDPASPSTTNLVSWWSMDETGGTRYDSYGANHNDLSDVHGGVVAVAKQGNAASFVPANAQYLSNPDTSNTLSTGDIDFTLIANVYLNSNTGGFVIVDKSDIVNTTVIDYRLTHNAGTGFRFRAGPTAYIDSGVVTANTWHTVIGWHDSVNNTLNIQVDDGVVHTLAYSGGSNDTSYPLTIGAFSNGTIGLDGRVDEVALYKRILTAAERTWLYNNGSGRSYADLTTQPPAGTPTITTLTYDHAGRKVTMTDPDMGYWMYGYDALGNLTSQTDARLCTLTLTYDTLNRLATKSSNNDADCVTQVNTTYTYDLGTNGKGRRTSMTSGAVSNAWTYDTRGLMMSATVNAVAAYTTQWDYNSADLPIWMKYPVDNEQVNYEYNDRMLLNKVSSTIGTYVASTTYDSAGRIDLRTFGTTPAIQTDYTYYAWDEKVNTIGQGGRLKYLQSGTSGTPTSLQDLAYTYDVAGNISNITNSLANEKQTYKYDSLGRLRCWGLTALNGASGCDTYNPATDQFTGSLLGSDAEYAYNTATGNLALKDTLSLSYTDAAHVHAVKNAGSNTYSYDANGNQTTRVVNGQTFTLSYDAENRLVSVTGPSMAASFVYDGDGNRVQSTINGTTTTFVGNIYEVTGSQVTKYYFAGPQRVAMRKYTIPQPMTVEYFLGDNLGSTSITTDNTGAKVSEMRYKPWGESRYSWTAETVTTPTYMLSNYTFTGQYSYMDDPSTTSVTEGFGLMFYNARMYDPAIGRFTSADTVIPGGVQGYDRYAYTSNNPIRYTDPSGHVSCSGSNWDDGPQCVGKQEFTQNAPKDKLAYEIHKRYRNVTVQDSYKWGLSQLNELEDALDYIYDKGFNHSNEAFNAAFGNVTFVSVANGSLGYVGKNPAIARADYDTGIIKATPGAALSTFIHEMGHILDGNNHRKDPRAPLHSQTFVDLYNVGSCDHSPCYADGGGYSVYPGSTTNYGTSSSLEDFADSFLEVIKNGSQTTSVSATRVEIITALVQSYTNYNPNSLSWR